MANWFPGLEAARPDLFGALEEEQYYHSNEWILGLLGVTNETKHVRLSLQARGDFEAVVIGCPGGTAIQVRQRGLKACKIEKGGTLTFLAADGTRPAIRGPETLDVNTRSLRDADPGIEVQVAKWRELQFDAHPGMPAALLVELSERNVRLFATKVAKLLGQPLPSDVASS
jgi:hypothetical protein